jgi:hypothetical protein
MERGNAGTAGGVRLVTIPAGARAVGIGTRQLRRAVRNGELPVFDVGAWPRVAWADLLAWVQERRRNHRRASRAEADEGGRR